MISLCFWIERVLGDIAAIYSRAILMLIHIHVNIFSNRIYDIWNALPITAVEGTIRLRRVQQILCILVLLNVYSTCIFVYRCISKEQM